MITKIQYRIAAFKEARRQARIAARVNRWMTRREAGYPRGGEEV